ncbi:glutathione S-transferase family protein [Falsiroseomonas selenitidurans]|uniref:Glutathione S-transferase family protein n=1 Tax=Falsiroseomonas selenitidurans TaxID=2716335 RepID=A0ABX1E9K1_9PROT|nr:glutathione S-transferase family protein [Falsiroseomonas selenitidurans]NKC33914.1 glutathione S-transferase family protein [Falsiroseomonas selenitidurans]
MAEGRLVIGTKRYSSWSLRGWLMVQLAGLAVEEQVIVLAGGGNTQAIRAISPNGLVPYLEHRGARIWESLAIAEYCAEIRPGLWPQEPAARAHARSIAAEMHAGFRALRMAMPMNLGRDFAGHGRTPECLADIARIEAIWAEALGQYGGPFLMGGDFGLVDAMYAPVVARFLTWKPAISPNAQAYCDAVRAHPLVDRWYREAAAEPAEWLLPKYENPVLG